MKKTYISPVLEVIRVHTQQMIATSINMYNSNATGEGMAPEFDSIFDEY